MVGPQNLKPSALSCLLIAWDSGVSGAPASLIALVSLALGIPAAAGLLSGNLRIHVAAAVVSTLLLLVARLLSGVEIRWYAMGWIFFVLLMMNWGYEQWIIHSGGDSGQAGPKAAT